MFIQSLSINHNFPTLNKFPFHIPVLQNTDSVLFDSPICFFVGENGTGKSALLDAISRNVGLLPWGGSKIHRVHHNPYETLFAKYIDLTWSRKSRYGFYFRSEAFFNFASSLDDILMDDPGRAAYFGGTSLNTLSHGESFLNFFSGYSFQLSGLYLMDEPESALSPKNQAKFVKILLKSVEKQDKQYIIATHSPILLGCPGCSILSFDFTKITKITLEMTKTYQLYNDFFRDPLGFYSRVLDD